MQLLLDTHTLIWFLEDNPLLKTKSKQLIEDETNDIYVSTISFYEMSIKLSIGKLVLPVLWNLPLTKRLKKILKLLT